MTHRAKHTQNTCPLRPQRYNNGEKRKTFFQQKSQFLTQEILSFLGTDSQSRTYSNKMGIFVWVLTRLRCRARRNGFWVRPRTGRDVD